MSNEEERWTTRGDGVFTGDEADDDSDEGTEMPRLPVQSNLPTMAMPSFGRSRMERLASTMSAGAQIPTSQPLEDRNNNRIMTKPALPYTADKWEEKPLKARRMAYPPPPLNFRNGRDRSAPRRDQSFPRRQRGAARRRSHKRSTSREMVDPRFGRPSGGFRPRNASTPMDALLMGSNRYGILPTSARRRSRAPPPSIRYGPPLPRGPTRSNRRGSSRLRSRPPATVPGGFRRFALPRTKNTPGVERLCLVGRVDTAAVDICVGNTATHPQENRISSVQFSDLAKVLNGYRVHGQFELQGIHVEKEIAVALMAIDESFWKDAEIIVHSCDFRALNSESFKNLFAKFVSPRIQFKGFVGIPTGCDLFSLPVVQAASHLKFCCSDSGHVPPTEKLSTASIIQWLMASGKNCRYLMLWQKQITSDIRKFIDELRHICQVTPHVTLFLLDLYTYAVPAVLHGPHVLQDFEESTQQRLNIRYDYTNGRVVAKRYTALTLQAKDFEMDTRKEAQCEAAHQSFRALAQTHSHGHNNSPIVHIEYPRRSSVASNETKFSMGMDVLSPTTTSSTSSFEEVPPEMSEKAKFIEHVVTYFGRIFDSMRAAGRTRRTEAFHEKIRNLILELEQLSLTE